MRKNKYFKVGILRLCPFCGEEPVVRTRYLNHAYEIRCENDKCHVKPSTGVHPTLIKCTEIWRGESR